MKHAVYILFFLLQEKQYVCSMLHATRVYTFNISYILYKKSYNLLCDPHFFVCHIYQNQCNPSIQNAVTSIYQYFQRFMT
jgi:hypothetical protein